MRLAVLSLLCLFGACFQEQPADRVWRCSADQPQCPEGQSCVNNWCVKDGTAMPDLAMSDAGMADMASPPCLNGFPLGTKGVWACRGAFSPTGTKASGLCRNGYKLCTDGSKVTSAECLASSISGFFFADVPGEGAMAALVKCAAGGNGSGATWFGCGSYVDGRSPSADSGVGCKNFTRISFCDTAGGFTCNYTDQRLDAQQLDKPANGVLCCPP